MQTKPVTSREEFMLWARGCKVGVAANLRLALLPNGEFTYRDTRLAYAAWSAARELYKLPVV